MMPVQYVLIAVLSCLGTFHALGTECSCRCDSTEICDSMRTMKTKLDLNNIRLSETRGLLNSCLASQSETEKSVQKILLSMETLEKNVENLLKKEFANNSNQNIADKKELLEATCDEPQPPKHGSVKLHGELKVNSIATYSCDPGRKLYGAAVTKCLISGKWTFDAPDCLSTCTVSFIENGEIGRYETRYTRREIKKVVAGSNVSSGETLFFRCKGDFLPLEGSQFVRSNRLEVTCNDGTWSKDLQCKPTHCTGSPPPAKNARPVVNSREHGYTIYYMCDKGHYTKIIGPVTCHFGSWIGTPPKCLNQPCYSKDLNYPGLVTPSEEHFESFESFDISCEIGYRKTSRMQKITCARGRWDVSENPCRMGNSSCSDLSHSPGLQVNYSNGLSVGSTATFRCSATSKILTGSNYSICQEGGIWSNPLPSCEDSKCSIGDLSLILPENVVPDISEDAEEHVAIGSVVRLTCDNNMVMTGEREAQCGRQGKWKLGNFECVPGCILDLDPSSHLVVHPMKGSYRVGEFVLLSCPPGEEMSNKVERLMCVFGGWSDSLPECI